LGIYSRETREQPFSIPQKIIEHLQILIRGVGLNAIEGDPDELKRFQHRMSAIAETLSGGTFPEDLLVGIGKTLRALEEYNRGAALIFRGQLKELRAMLSTMIATVKFVTSSSETSVRQLSVVEAKLQRASTLEDIRQVKTSLTDCLCLVRNESLRLQSETRGKMADLKNEVERLSSRLRAAARDDSEDPVTGLKGRSLAEEEIKNKIHAGRDFLVALFIIDRIASINGRFGRLVGDDILIIGAQTLAQKLSGTTLYRWSGPAFVAVFDSSVDLTQAQSRATQAAAMRVEKSIEAGNRSALIVITASCHLQRVSSESSPEEILRKMDEFMAAQGQTAPWP